MFALDHVLHVPQVQSLYLWHSHPRWWQVGACCTSALVCMCSHWLLLINAGLCALDHVLHVPQVQSLSHAHPRWWQVGASAFICTGLRVSPLAAADQCGAVRAGPRAACASSTEPVSLAQPSAVVAGGRLLHNCSGLHVCSLAAGDHCEHDVLDHVLHGRPVQSLYHWHSRPRWWQVGALCRSSALHALH